MIRELKTFVAVARYGTLAKTAVRIGLTQSAISAQIRRLEDELGFELFDRSGRALHLTPAGNRSLQRVSELLTLYARLSEPDRQYADVGMVRLGAIASAASYLTEVLVDFRSRLPGWTVRVVPGVSFDFVAQVDAGEIDLAVMIRPPFALAVELEWISLAKEPYVLITSADRSDGDWRELLMSEPFIRYDRNAFGGRSIDRFLKRQKIVVNEAFELDDLPSIRDLVARGAGVAIVPENYLVAGSDRVRTVEIDEPFAREMGLLRRHSDGADDGCELMVQLILSTAGAARSQARRP